MTARVSPLVALAGPHNSGKTGLLERLVAAASKRGYRVGVIKRAARPLQIDPAGKDSARFAAAGAARVVAIGPGQLMMSEPAASAPSLRVIRQRLGRGVDLWLVETYTPEPVPWLAVSKSRNQAPAIDRYCLATVGFRVAALPSFPIAHTGRILDFLLVHARGSS